MAHTQLSTPVAMTIAGSDPSGGAGLQADLKTFHQHGCYGTSVVTLITAQNTQAVTSLEFLSPTLVLAQLDAVLSDMNPQAAKTGALGSKALIEAVVSRARKFSFPLVVDPVMISKHGHRLIDDAAVQVLRDQLFPLAWLVTPNRREAEELSGIAIVDEESAVLAGAAIQSMGPKNVLIKLGQLPSSRDSSSMDRMSHYRMLNGHGEFMTQPRIDSKPMQGTGCVLSAAIAARLARGEPIEDTISQSIQFVSDAIEQSPPIGHGCGVLQTLVPINGPGC